MGFLNSLFGGSENTLLVSLFALGAVLVLIVLGVWALKMLFNATSGVGRGRNRRLSVIDTAPVDGKRQLLLIRRDDCEHLLLIGGAQDVVIETGITPPPESETQRRGRRPLASAKSVGSKNAPNTTKTMVAPTTGEDSDVVPPHKAPTAAATAAVALARLDRFSNQNEPSTDAKLGVPEVETPTAPKKVSSLRHTGLMRPAARVEPALHPQPSDAESEIDAPKKSDSATKPDKDAKPVPVLGATMDSGSDAGGTGGTEDKDASTPTPA